MDYLFIDNKKRRMTRIKYILSAILIILILAGIFGYYHFNNYFKSAPVVKETEKHLAEVKKDKPVNILLVGTDERGSERARTDTIMIISVDSEKKTVKMLSIPRDTYVDIPGRGMDKINHAHAFGGMPLAIDTIQKFLGQPIHYFVRTNFNGFKDIVDTLGGIDIDVDKNMDGLNKGTQRLNGEKALIFVRHRYSDAEADITRIGRQQKFVQAVANEMLQGDTILKLPDLLPQLKNALETNMSVSEIVNTANKVKGYNNSNIGKASIPGKPIMLNGISYWQPDVEKTKTILKETFGD